MSTSEFHKMVNRIYTDRSRIVTAGRCRRKRWLEYHESGTGIVSKRQPLALAVGSAVHTGLVTILTACMDEDLVIDILNGNADARLRALEETAVRVALEEFSPLLGLLDAEVTEQPASLTMPASASPANPFDQQMIAQAIELGLDPEAFKSAGVPPEIARGRMDAYLFAEQSALVEAMVRAWARRRLRPLLEEFEVLEVEREGEWKLVEWWDDDVDGVIGTPNHELWFLSRPDALLRHRQTNELQILSFKTTGAWDTRKARDIQHDMQGLSEGVEIERRLGEWWQLLKNRIMPQEGNPPGDAPSQAMYDYLSVLSAPPRVSAIRYEFLLKGERWKDKDLSAQLGIDGARVQKSHLIYQYVAQSTPKSGKNTDSFRVGDVCWSWDFTRIEDQQSSKLYAGNWRPRAVWEAGTHAVREWIDKLDRSELCMSGEDSTVGMVPRPLGFKSDAQAMGVTAEHPLDAVFVPPVTVYRSDDDLRDWVEQTAAGERTMAEAVALVRIAEADGDLGEKRSLLNQHFGKERGACEYPGTCQYARDRVGICWAGAEMQARPLEVGAGEYIKRTPNHPREAEELSR